MVTASKAKKSEAAGLAMYSDILTKAVPPCRTWPVRMPPYCYTELCPDARYRPEIKKHGKGHRAYEEAE